MSMHRRAWRMTLRPEGIEAYDKAHAEIWPEMVDEMRANGVTDFAIYRDGRHVFAFQQRSTPFPDGTTPPSPTILRWWKAMAPLMVTDMDDQPIRKNMSEVFVLTPKEPRS